MSRVKALTVFGTRPEAIKMAPVVKALAADDRFDHCLCVTAQHRDMLDQVLELFELTPDHDLDLMRPGQNLFELTSRILLGMKPVLDAEQPEVVLVHGDTTTTLATTLASFYGQVPVAHVEAGLRTGNLAAPWPEEANRVLADRICRFHFPPTERAAGVLRGEGLDPDRIAVTGNTVIDALLDVRDRLGALPFDPAALRQRLARDAGGDARVVLVTGHRRESFGDGFLNICRALRALAASHPRRALRLPRAPEPQRAPPGGRVPHRGVEHPPHRAAGLRAPSCG